MQVHGAGTTEPLALASALVAFANASGGHDNITAAVARVDLGQNADSPSDGGPTGAGAQGGVPSNG